MFITHILRLIRERRRFRRNLEELSSLSDRELADIGMSRSDLFRLAHGYKDF